MIRADMISTVGRAYLKWERFYGIYLNASKFIENADQAALDNYHDLESTLEAIELELISCREPLAKE